MPSLRFDILVDNKGGKVAMQQFAQETDSAFKKAAAAVSKVSNAALPEHEQAVLKVQRKYQSLATEINKLEKSGRISKGMADEWHNAIGVRMDSDLNKLKATGSRVFSSMTANVKAFAAAAVVGSASIMARNILDTADQYTLLDNKLKLVTDSSAQLQSVQDGLYEQALRSHGAYSASVDLYSRFAKATESMGTSQADLLRITETLNKATIISGATQTEASAAMTQLSQGMASGVLRGEEFNSIMENSSRIAKMLADYLQTDIGGLREMSKEGKITSDIMIAAFSAASSSVDSEFSKMQTTISQAMTDLKTVFGSVINDANALSGGTNKIADSIENLASTIDTNRDGIVSLFAGIVEGANIAAKTVLTLSNMLNVGKKWSEYSATVGTIVSGRNVAADHLMATSHSSSQQIPMSSSHGQIPDISATGVKHGKDSWQVKEANAAEKEAEAAGKRMQSLADQWDKTKRDLEQEVGTAGMDGFQRKIQEVKDRAADLRAQFGDKAEIGSWEAATIAATMTAEETRKATEARSAYNKACELQVDIVNEVIAGEETLADATLTESQRSVTAIYQKYDAYDELIKKQVEAGNKTEEWGAKTHQVLAVRMQEDFDSINNKAKGVADEMKDAFSGWANNMSSTFNDVLWGAELSFGGILESFGKMLSQMVIQTMIVKPLLDSIMGYASGGGSSSWVNPDTGATWANGGAFSGISGYSNQIVSSPTFFKHSGVTAFASGGGVMGEAGPEAVMPLTKVGGHLGVDASGIGGGTVNVIIQNNGSKTQASATEVKNASGGKDIVVMIEDIVGNSIMSGRGKINKAMRSTFGASPVLAGR